MTSTKVRGTKSLKNRWLSEVKWLEGFSIKSREQEVSFEKIEQRKKVKKQEKRKMTDFKE